VLVPHVDASDVAVNQTVPVVAMPPVGNVVPSLFCCVSADTATP
jgi:hypothetical protein